MSDKPDSVNKPFVFPTASKHPETPEEALEPVIVEPSEDAIDAGIEESFPASDPVSVTVTKVLPVDEKPRK
jgi:hypothetical protein